MSWRRPRLARPPEARATIPPGNKPPPSDEGGAGWPRCGSFKARAQTIRQPRFRRLSEPKPWGTASAGGTLAPARSRRHTKRAPTVEGTMLVILSGCAIHSCWRRLSGRRRNLEGPSEPFAPFGGGKDTPSNRRSAASASLGCRELVRPRRSSRWAVFSYWQGSETHSPRVVRRRRGWPAAGSRALHCGAGHIPGMRHARHQDWQELRPPPAFGGGREFVR